MIKRSYNAISQVRVDVGDLRSIESAGRADFDDLLKSLILGENQSYILRGFDINMTGAIGSSANALQMIVAESALLHGTSTLAGTVQVIASGTANEVLNSTTNTRVSGSFTPNATNYVGLEYTRQVDNSTVSQRMVWDPTNKVEIAKTLPLAEIFDYQIVISSSLFAANVCPIAIVVTDTANNVLSVTDRRPLLFRLGTAGYSSPDPAYVYPWDHDIEGRLENPYTSTSATSPFKGGDKMLLQFKEWMDAVMSKLKEIGGTTYWYTFSSSIEDTLKFINSSVIPLAETVKFIWQNGTLSITDELAASTDATNELQIKLIGSSQLIYLTKELNIAIADNEVLYVTLPTTGNRTYDGVGAADTNYKVGSADTFTKDGYNYWLAYRSGNRLTIRGLGEIENGVTKEMGNYTYEPSGFVNRTDSQMSFVDGTRTFTIEPVATYFEFFCKGAKFTKTTAQDKVIADTEGLHFLYFDDEGVLQETTSMTKAIITESAYVAVIYWDATSNASYYMGDERHGISMDGETHYYLHTVLGAQYGAGAVISGLVGDGTGDVDGDLTFALTATDVIDEDIRQTLDAKAEVDNIPKFYRDDTGAWKKVGTADPYPGYSTGSANGRVYWNDQTFAGGLVEVGQANFVLGHIAATNDPDMPYIVILGQAEYGTVTAARAGAESELSSLVTVGLPTTELIFLYTVILQTNSGYASTIKARIRTIDSATQVDWRVTNYNGITAPSTATRFIDLTDTPASYVGNAGKIVKVNSAEDGLEFGNSTNSSTDTITAFAGGGQLNATQLTATVNRITVCVTAGDSVKLPPTFSAGDEITIINDAAKKADLFPSSGDYIENLAVDTAIQLLPNTRMILKATTSNQNWRIVSPVVQEIQDYTVVGSPGASLQQYMGVDFSVAELENFFGVGTVKAYYRFGAGAALGTDETGTYNLTLGAGAAEPSNTTGYLNTNFGISFDGGDYAYQNGVLLDDLATQFPNGFTHFFCFAAPTDGMPAAQSFLFFKRNSAANDFYTVTLETSGELTISTRGNSGTTISTTHNVTMPNGANTKYYFCCVTWNTTTGLVLYVNGQMVDSATNATTLMVNGTTTDLYLGSNSTPGNYFTGKIMNSIFINAAPTPRQIRLLFSTKIAELPILTGKNYIIEGFKKPNNETAFIKQTQIQEIIKYNGYIYLPGGLRSAEDYYLLNGRIQ